MSVKENWLLELWFCDVDRQVGMHPHPLDPPLDGHRSASVEKDDLRG